MYLFLLFCSPFVLLRDVVSLAHVHEIAHGLGGEQIQRVDHLKKKKKKKKKMIFKKRENKKRSNIAHQTSKKKNNKCISSRFTTVIQVVKEYNPNKL